jgi:8-oxo-dGTP diphosphatase
VTEPAGHALFDRWTGKHATALQTALRMSQDEMAALLGVAKRTIASWHERPDVVIRPELQRALDTAYERAPDAAKARFARQLSADEKAEVQAAAGHVAFTVAIAVVVNESDVLLVCRRDSEPNGITWQFPAGIIKPGASASTVAIRETLAETGIHCAVRAPLGQRVHPITGVNCEYFLCDYLAGTVENRDTLENVDAIWVPKRDLTRFIPAERIFEPIMRTLEES